MSRFPNEYDDGYDGRDAFERAEEDRPDDFEPALTLGQPKPIRLLVTIEPDEDGTFRVTSEQTLDALVQFFDLLALGGEGFGNVGVEILD